MSLPQHEGWIAWAGGKSPPVVDDTVVEVKYRGERRNAATMPAGNFSWPHWGDGTDIIAYRFVAQKLSLESGKIYLDEDGYLHGPMVETESVFYAGGMGSWLPDGEPADSDSVRLIGEWIAPVPQHAAEENERLRGRVSFLERKLRKSASDLESVAEELQTQLSEARGENERLRQTVVHQKQEIGKLHSQIGRLQDEAVQRSGDRQDDLAKLCERLGQPGPPQPRAPVEVFNDCLVAIDKLKHDVEMHRDAAADLADDLRRVESRCLLALHAACVEAGVNVPSDNATDEESVYGHLVDGIRALRRDISLHEEIAAEIKAEWPGPGYTAVYIPSDRLEEFSGACSDLGCWMRGYVAGLPRDEFGNVTGEREPMGRYVVTEINIALKSALNRAAVEKKS